MKCEVHLHDEGVRDAFEDFALGHRILDLLLLADKSLLEDLHCVEFARVLLFDQEHLAVRALANDFDHGEVCFRNFAAAALPLRLSDQPFIALDLLVIFKDFASFVLRLASF